MLFLNEIQKYMYINSWTCHSYGEILTTLFMRFKSRDPVICIFITWSRDYDSYAIDRFYTKNKKYELFPAIRISRNRYGS